MILNCSQCRKPLQLQDWVASISGSICGDEYSDTFYYCRQCSAYTLLTTRDNFTGEQTTSESGPIEKQDGDARLALIGQCDSPWDKKCRCPAHLAYFNNTLD